MLPIYPTPAPSTPNAHGVYMEAETHTVYESGSCKVSLQLAQSLDGKFLCGYCYHMPLGGGSCGAMAPGYDTQYAAEEAALLHLLHGVRQYHQTQKGIQLATAAEKTILHLLDTHRQASLAQLRAENAALKAQLARVA